MNDRDIIENFRNIDNRLQAMDKLLCILIPRLISDSESKEDIIKELETFHRNHRTNWGIAHQIISKIKSD